MALRLCAQCGIEITAPEIRHRRRVFCSDECCEAFEDVFLIRGGPDPIDLAFAATGLGEEVSELSDDLIAPEIDWRLPRLVDGSDELVV
jgi:hypothetical protein